MSEQGLRQWQQLFYWAAPLIVILGVIGMILIVGLLMAWRRYERRQSQARRSLLRSTSSARHVDTWKASARRLTGHDEEASDNPTASSSLTDDDLSDLSEFPDNADQLAQPWDWEPEPVFGEADEDAPWRSSLDSDMTFGDHGLADDVVDEEDEEDEEDSDEATDHGDVNDHDDHDEPDDPKRR